MTPETIDSMIEQLKYLKKCVQSHQRISEKLAQEEDHKKREKLYPKMMLELYDVRNQERRVWHKMQIFEVSLEPDDFHASGFHKYKLWTPNN